MTDVTTLILPGLFNSGPEHWQTVWERLDPSCQRVLQENWETPSCVDWVATLDRAIGESTADVVLVAHSSACAMVAHWTATAGTAQLSRVRGALLVGPSDPEGPNYPAGPTGFAPVPRQPLPFRSIVVASTNDEYVTLAQAKAYAKSWGSNLVDVGAAGHINGASNLGTWPQGYALLNDLRRRPQSRGQGFQVRERE